MKAVELDKMLDRLDHMSMQFHISDGEADIRTVFGEDVYVESRGNNFSVHARFNQEFVILQGGGDKEILVELGENVRGLIIIGGGDVQLQVEAANPETAVLVSGGGKKAVFADGFLDQEQILLSGGGEKHLELTAIPEMAYLKFQKKKLLEERKVHAARNTQIDTQVAEIDVRIAELARGDEGIAG